jgi:hypothetical protein
MLLLQIEKKNYNDNEELVKKSPSIIDWISL